MPFVTETWTKNDFLAFLMIYASNADMDISAQETSWIRQQFGREQYKNAFSLFHQQSDYENIQVITHLKENFFPGEVGKMALRSYLLDLFEMDGDYSLLERTVLRGLERLF